MADFEAKHTILSRKRTISNENIRFKSKIVESYSNKHVLQMTVSIFNFELKMAEFKAKLSISSWKSTVFNEKCSF